MNDGGTRMRWRQTSVRIPTMNNRILQIFAQWGGGQCNPVPSPGLSPFAPSSVGVGRGRTPSSAEPPTGPAIWLILSVVICLDQVQNLLVLFQTLINKGAVVNFGTHHRATALYYAAQNGHVATLQLLLQHEADANMAIKDGWTPLHAASETGHSDAIKILCERGADVMLTNKRGETALYIAALNKQVLKSFF